MTNKEAFDGYIEIWNNGNYEELSKYLAENVQRRVPETANQNTDNLSGLIEVMKTYRTAFPDSKVTIQEFYEIDDRTFGKFTFSGTNTGDWDLPTTGKEANVQGGSFMRYKDGKIIEETIYYDVLGFMAQLGIIELPEGEAAASA